jgi:SAM-dependent methyltransferase
VDHEQPASTVEAGAYRQVNLANWNSRVPHHLQGYDIASLLADPQALSDVVRFDVERLGSIGGLDVVHLQCHIGTDTLSLHRLGAASVTGVDFSQPALDGAAALAARCGADIRWVCADVYDAPRVLGEACCDLVYTGVGALCWLPSVREWAAVVGALLRPGGRLFIREGHPMLWSLADPRPDGLLVVEHPYFEVPGGTRFRTTSTYVPHEGELAAPDTIEFNHGLGEIVTALHDAGLRLLSFDEHDTVPWAALGDAMVDVGGGEYALREGRARLPLSYTLRAEKS